MDVGVDVGGTFTDVVAIDGRGGVRIAKVPSTPEDQSKGFIKGLKDADAHLADVAALVHGSTVAINALLERKGSSAALITTRGFRDVLELRRRDRPNAYGLKVRFEPLIPRHRRFEVGVRVDENGNVLGEISDDELKNLHRRLESVNAEALVISLFNGYRNPLAEREIADRIVALGWPEDRITVASEINQEIREFERTTTAAISAYVQPVMARYLTNLAQALSTDGFRSNLLIAQSNGGAIHWQECARVPVNSVMSGPSAGAIACASIATEAGFKNAVACDVGGTSCDITLIVNGLPAMRPESELEFGMPIRRPMIDVASIAAGGGSVAELDRGGILRVGPRSAGARPGPACYGLGGKDATVTDAQVVLGRLGADMALGTSGDLRLNRELAESVIRERVADPLGLSVEAAAAAIIRITELNIASATRRLSTERGHDPREFALVMFGGAGPAHVCSLMRQLTIPAALIPTYPGATSALGCLLCDLRLDYVHSINARLDSVVMPEVQKIWRDQLARAQARLEESSVATENTDVITSLACCYEGQAHTLELAVTNQNAGADALTAAFESQYRHRFGRALEDFPIVVRGVRMIVRGIRARRALPPYKGTAGPVRPDRRVWSESGWSQAKVIHRATLTPGKPLNGPIVIEQDDATIWIEPEFRVELLPNGTLVIRS